MSRQAETLKAKTRRAKGLLSDVLKSDAMKYALRRILLSALTVLAVITITFFAMHAIPGGPFQAEKALSPEAEAALMEKYGLEAELDNLCEKWVEVWTDNFDKIKMAQEIDPITGEPTRSSEWYSSTMLFYLYAVRRESI